MCIQCVCEIAVLLGCQLLDTCGVYAIRHGVSMQIRDFHLQPGHYCRWKMLKLYEWRDGHIVHQL